jgi:N-acetylneuraminate synthase
MPNDVIIAHREIGPNRKPFIIAEMSGNHNQSLERALGIVEAAARSGVDALKLQTYTADTMTLDLNRDEFTISDKKSLWYGKSLYQLYREAYTPWEWHEPIIRRCRELGLIVFSTPFDETAVEFLESLEIPAYKVASFENTDLSLIRRIARTGKPMIISTGMASIDELHETMDAARTAGCSDLILLKCTSSYPASAEHSNLCTIPDMMRRFDVPVGLSDHTIGIEVALAAVGLGASVIEKHFTLSRSDGGPDAAFSLEPTEMAQLTAGVAKAWKALGGVYYGSTEGEKRSLQFRRSLYVVADVKAGDCLTKANLRAIRPGFGLSPKHYDQLLGRCVTRDVVKGTPVTWDIVQSRVESK